MATVPSIKTKVRTPLPGGRPGFSQPPGGSDPYVGTSKIVGGIVLQKPTSVEGMKPSPTMGPTTGKSPAPMHAGGGSGVDRGTDPHVMPSGPLSAGPSSTPTPSRNSRSRR